MSPDTTTIEVVILLLPIVVSHLSCDEVWGKGSRRGKGRRRVRGSSCDIEAHC